MTLPGAPNPMLASASASMVASGGPELISHLQNDTEGITTPRSLYGWEGPAAAWPCHCCNRVNEERTKRCKTCGRSAAYVPPLHFPFFGTMAKALRPGQAVFLLNERGSDVNATDSENWTPAHLAAAYGNIGLLRVLLDSGARVDAQTKRGWRPLHFAALEGHLACVELLLSKRAGVSGATKGCRSTPLHVAAGEGYTDICRRLLAERADPEARDVMGRSPLHLAAGNGHLEALRALLEAGVEVDVLDHDKWLPRQIAEFRGFLEVAAVLAKEKMARLEGGEGGTHGASTVLPPAPWHVDIFAQVRKDAARPRKLEALSASREATYARYTDVYKGDAAEAYARAIEASRREKGGVEAYRRRVVSASLDADRYRGFHETPAAFFPPAELREGIADVEEGVAGSGSGAGSEGGGGGGGGISLMGSSSTSSSQSHHHSSGGSGEAAAKSATKATSTIPAEEEVGRQQQQQQQHGKGGGVGDDGEVRDIGTVEEKMGGARCSRPDSSSVVTGTGIAGGGSREVVFALLPGAAEPIDSKQEQEQEGEERHAAAAAAAASDRGGSGGGSGSGAAFADVVPFNNVRAKYLRPWNDTALSRPYRVPPLSDWRDSRGGRGTVTVGSSVSTMGGGGSSRCSASAAGSEGAAVEEARLMAARAERKHSSTALNRRDRKAWGGE